MQEKVRNFNKIKNCHLKPMPVYARLLDIQSELGELSKEYLKHSKYGTKDFILENDFKMEYCDVLYSLLSLADELQIDTNECLNLVITKYQDRIKNLGTMGSKKD